MYTKLYTCALIGLDGYLIEVEVDIFGTFPSFNIVGLPDPAIQEARERIKSAIRNSKLNFPVNKKILINLAPSNIKKEGSAYDLSMAIGILIAQKRLILEILNNSLFIGELSLDGELRHTKGVLAMAIFAKENGIENLFIPYQNLNEASLIPNIKIFPVKNLRQLYNHILGVEKIKEADHKDINDFISEQKYQITFEEIKGQCTAKRAMQIAAAGSHNILLEGPPGTGKTMLAKALPSILPPMNLEEVLEVSKIYSIAGLLNEEIPLITTRPFRSPHHTSSNVALAGGGTFPKPGEISLAHRGVLFLDEFPEFSRTTLEILRQPLEDGIVRISRASSSVSYPSRFMLVASQNPCPCGYYQDPEKNCTCTLSQIIKYKKKISGPLLDRIDLFVKVPRVKINKLSSEEIDLEYSSKKLREKVLLARQRQYQRFKDLPILTNAEMRPKEIREFCKLKDEEIEILKSAVLKYKLTARAYFKIIKVARTIADLEGHDEILIEDLNEALNYRKKDDFLES